jgi:hypothetical protein
MTLRARLIKSIASSDFPAKYFSHQYVPKLDNTKREGNKKSEQVLQTHLKREQNHRCSNYEVT